MPSRICLSMLLAAQLLLAACANIVVADTRPQNIRGLPIDQLAYFRLPADFSGTTGQNGRVYIWHTDHFSRQAFADPRRRDQASCYAFVTDREDKILSRRQDRCIHLLQRYRLNP